jgi:hypothetical protein
MELCVKSFNVRKKVLIGTSWCFLFFGVAEAEYTPKYLTESSQSVDQDTSLSATSASSDFVKYLTSSSLTTNQYLGYYQRMLQAMPDLMALTLGATSGSSINGLVSDILTYVHTKGTSDGEKANNFHAVVQDYAIHKAPTTATEDNPVTQTLIGLLFTAGSPDKTISMGLTTCRSVSPFSEAFLNALKTNGSLDVVGTLAAGNKIDTLLQENDITGKNATTLVNGIEEYCSALAVLAYCVLTNDADNTFKVVNAIKNGLVQETGKSSNSGNMSTDVKTSLSAALFVANGNEKVVKNSTPDQVLKYLMGIISGTSAAPTTTTVTVSSLASANVLSTILRSNTIDGTTTYTVTPSVAGAAPVTINLEKIITALKITRSDHLSGITGDQLIALNTIATATTSSSSSITQDTVSQLLDIINVGTVERTVVYNAVTQLVNVLFSKGGALSASAVGTTGNATADAVGALIVSHPQSLYGVTSDDVNSNDLAFCVTGQMTADQRADSNQLGMLTEYVTDSGIRRDMSIAFDNAY